MADFYRDVARLLRDNGYYVKHQGKGDHEKRYNDSTNITLTVPSKLNKRHTANGILKQAGINKKL